MTWPLPLGTCSSPSTLSLPPLALRSTSSCFSWANSRLCDCNCYKYALILFHIVLLFLFVCLCVLFFSISLSCPLFPSLSLFVCLFACLLHKGSGVLLSLLPASFEHLAVSRARNRPTLGTTPLRSPCSRANFTRVTTACVSSPCDWVVSTGSHVQQDVDISYAPPHLGGPYALRETVRR